MSGFARHLPTFNWDVHVLTAARSGEAPTRCDVVVHSVDDPLAKEQPFADYDPRVSPAKWKSLAREFVFPDRFFKWRKAAMPVGRALMEEIRFDVLLTSFPPASAVHLALGLAQKSGVPLVTDFRDRWFGPGGYEPSLSMVRQRHEKLKHEAVTLSKRVLVVSDAMANAISAERQAPRSKFVVIPNGYEARTMDRNRANKSADYDNPSKPRPFIIAHVGTVIARNRPELFFESLTRLKDDRRLMGVQFRFVGNLSREFISSLELSGKVTATGLVSRDEASHEMESADALLLLTGDYVGRWGASAKLYEYVQTGLPVLCLEESPGSNDRKLLEQFIGDRAFFAPMNEPAAIAAQIEALRVYRLARPAAAIELDASFRDFSRENLTARLATALDEVVRH